MPGRTRTVTIAIPVSEDRFLLTYCHERRHAMTRPRIAVLVLLALTAVLPLHAQLVSGRFVTSAYTWEQYDTVGSSATYVRAFQVAQLSVAQGDLSFHTYLQGALNATSEFGDLGRIRVYNLYLKWADIGKAVDLTAGRQAVYAGVGAGTIDGGMVRARMFDKTVTAVAYAGAPVVGRYDWISKGWDKGLAFGGQITTSLVENTKIGVSYANWREDRPAYVSLRARDTTFAPYQVPIDVDDQAYQYVGGDIHYRFENKVSLYGRYDYDINFERTARFQAGARFDVVDRLGVTADYIYRIPRVAFNSIFSAFIANNVEEMEFGADYEILPRWKAFGKVARVMYNTDESNRWTLGVAGSHGSLSYSGSDGYAGQLQSVTLQGAYPLMERMIIPNVAVNYASYRLSADDDRQDALSLAAGATVRPSQPVSIDAQVQLLTNKYYSNDVRLHVRFTYWFAEQLTLF